MYLSFCFHLRMPLILHQVVQVHLFPNLMGSAARDSLQSARKVEIVKL